MGTEREDFVGCESGVGAGAGVGVGEIRVWGRVEGLSAACGDGRGREEGAVVGDLCYDCVSEWREEQSVDFQPEFDGEV